MCTSKPDMPKPKAAIIPESAKRVGKDQRRVTTGNNQAAAKAASATNFTQGSGSTTAASKDKKSLLGA